MRVSLGNRRLLPQIFGGFDLGPEMAAMVEDSWECRFADRMCYALGWQQVYPKVVPTAKDLMKLFCS